MGIMVDLPTNIFCDNMSVVNNASRPELTLSKKHNQICFHRAREAVAAGICRVGWVDGIENLADLFTKVLPKLVRKNCPIYFGEFNT